VNLRNYEKYLECNVIFAKILALEAQSTPHFKFGLL